MLTLKTIILLSVIFCILSVNAQESDRNGGKLRVRKEWRTLDDKDKKSYIKAIKCLNKESSGHKDSSKWPGTQTRFDDLVLVHILSTEDIHFNGQFLPWHRYHLLLHEQLLRSVCKYEGPLPYWDVLRDLPPVTSDFFGSPIFDPETGFGGNGEFTPLPDDYAYFGVDMTPLPLDGQGPVSEARGNALVASQLPFTVATRTGGGCINEGEFKEGDFVIRLGPNNATRSNPRCLRRDFVPSLPLNLPVAASLQSLTNAATYLEISSLIGLAHGVGHGGPGGLLGEMGNIFSSPNDPLFFLHHANVDRIWWNWQAADLEKRLTDMEGFAYSIGDELVSLDFELEFPPMAGPVPIGDVMDIRKLGYSYDNS